MKCLDIRFEREVTQDDLQRILTIALGVNAALHLYDDGVPHPPIEASLDKDTACRMLGHEWTVRAEGWLCKRCGKTKGTYERD